MALLLLIGGLLEVAGCVYHHNSHRGYHEDFAADRPEKVRHRHHHADW